MRRDAFMKQLEYLLQDIPDADKADALLYYSDYLEEAGDVREEKVIEEFGSPERIAAIIRADIMGNLEDGGGFTENGYVDERFRDPNYQVVKRADLPERTEEAKASREAQGGPNRSAYQNTQQNFHTGAGAGRDAYQSGGSGGDYNHVKKEPWTSRPLKWALWAVLLLVASPVILTVGGVGFGLLTGLVSVVAAGIITLLCLTAVAFILCVVFAVFGVVFLAASPMEGLMLFGFSIIGLGCGLIGLVLIVILVGALIPFAWRCLVKLFRLVTGRKGKKAYE